MRRLFLLVLASGLVAVATASAQTSSQKELPSAPSATVQEQMRRQQPPPPPPQPQQQPAPSQSTSNQNAAPASDPATAAKATTPPAEDATTPNAPATSEKTGDPNGDDSAAFKYTVTTNEVNVVFTVTDKHGKFIKDLKRDDFKVLDNSQPPKQVRAFHAETDLPLRVGLLVDASNSVRDRFSFEQEAAVEFLNQIIRPKSDRAFVIGFDTTAEVTQDLTDDTEKLSKGVHALRAGGGTALYDALFYACRDKLQKSASQNSAVRRAIILLSDGEDNQSRVTREEAIEMAQRSEVIIYSISTNVSGVKLHGDKVLERLAEATGGRAFFPFKVQDVANAFSEIQDELRSQYQLAYKPADLQPDGRYHSIEILAENHKNLKVRARKGYYAPKQ